MLYGYFLTAMYTQYCAYHGSVGTSPPIIYANMPFGNLSVYQNPGQPSPTGDPVADAVTSTASHEVSESITARLVNVNSAWLRPRAMKWRPLRI